MRKLKKQKIPHRIFAEKPTIAIVGLGYVGLPLALAFSKTNNVIGYDINKKRVSDLLAGFDETMECSSEELKSANQIKFSSDEQDLGGRDIFIVTVPTPIDIAKRPELSLLKEASATIGRHLKKGGIVIFESTVFPGATEEICVPILEKISQLKYNHDFFCGYSPERVNPGDKINTLEKITKIVSGSTPEIAEKIDALYAQIITAGTWRASSIKIAEAAKVIENTQRDLNIAFVNELSVIFERLGIDTLEVLEAAASKWNFIEFRPGMVGGHCIGVDPYYLTHKAEEVGYIPQIVLAGRRLNDNMARYAAKNIIKRMARRGINLSNSTVGVLGVTFKENCPDVRNSKIFDFIEELVSWGITVKAIDPFANHREVETHYNIQLVEELEQKSCDALVVAVGHAEYRALTPDEIAGYCKKPTIAVVGDLKSLYDKESLEELGLEIFRL